MVTHILKKAGLSVKAVGNIGESYSLSVALEKFDYYVIELSSFQLDRMYEFKADISIILNISSDHLDDTTIMTLQNILRVNLEIPK